MEGRDSGSPCRGGPQAQVGHGPFSFFNREAGFSLMGNPPSIITPTAMRHSTVMPSPNPNLPPNLNSEPNSNCVMPNLNPNAIPNPNQSSSTFFDAGSPAATTPPLGLLANMNERSLESAKRKVGRPRKYVKDENGVLVTIPQSPKPVSQKKRGPAAGKKAQLFALGLQHIFDMGSMPQSMSSGIISFIPKGGDASTLQQWGPITLMSLVYKILARMISARLRPFLPDLIHLSQTGFVQDCSFLDNVVTFYDAVEWARQTGSQPTAIMLLDFEKAYNRVEWDFLEGTLSRMGFPQPGIHEISALHRSASSARAKPKLQYRRENTNQSNDVNVHCVSMYKYTSYQYILVINCGMCPMHDT
ncbi:hypothetical protein L7F22_012764 [Adiantum nelumboides]|nr:hypothetical protein [Adiantum nelumboides]